MANVTMNGVKGQFDYKDIRHKMDTTIIVIFSSIILILVTGLKLIIFSHLITSDR